MFMVQAREFTPDSCRRAGCCHFFVWPSKGEESVPLTKQSGMECFKNSCSTLVDNRWSPEIKRLGRVLATAVQRLGKDLPSYTAVHGPGRPQALPTAVPQHCTHAVLMLTRMYPD